MQFSKHKIAYLCAAVLCIALLGIYLLLNGNDQPSLPPKNVEAHTVQSKILTRTFQILGQVKSQRYIIMKAQRLGIINRIFVQPGERVTKGTLLAHFKNDEVKQTYEAARNKLLLMKKNVTRKQELFEKKGISKSQLEEHQSAHLQAEIDFLQLQKQYEDTLFKAPFDGIVGLFYGEEGSTINANEKLVAVYDPASVEVELTIPELLLPSIKKGMQVQVQGSTGTITGVEAFLNPETHMGRALVKFKQPPAHLLIGAYVFVQLELQNKAPSLLVPREAVFYYDGHKHVYVIHEGKARLRPVETGLHNKQEVEIIEGLKANEQIILKGQESLWDHAPVKVQADA